MSNTCPTNIQKIRIKQSLSLYNGKTCIHTQNTVSKQSFNKKFTEQSIPDTSHSSVENNEQQ